MVSDDMLGEAIATKKQRGKRIQIGSHVKKVTIETLGMTRDMMCGKEWIF